METATLRSWHALASWPDDGLAFRTIAEAAKQLVRGGSRVDIQPGGAPVGVNEEGPGHVPTCRSEIAPLCRSAAMPLDVARIQVSQPGEHGFCSLGVGLDHTRQVTRCDEHVFAEVDGRMPSVLGDAWVHVRALHHVVEGPRPRAAPETEPADAVSPATLRNVADRMNDAIDLERETRAPTVLRAGFMIAWRSNRIGSTATTADGARGSARSVPSAPRIEPVRPAGSVGRAGSVQPALPEGATGAAGRGWSPLDPNATHIDRIASESHWPVDQQADASRVPSSRTGKMARVLRSTADPAWGRDATADLLRLRARFPSPVRAIDELGLQARAIDSTEVPNNERPEHTRRAARAATAATAVETSQAFSGGVLRDRTDTRLQIENRVTPPPPSTLSHLLGLQRDHRARLPFPRTPFSAIDPCPTVALADAPHPN